MGIESKYIKIFKINKKSSKGRIILTKQIRGIVKNIKEQNIVFSSYFIGSLMPVDKKEYSGMVLNIESKKGKYNIEFPIALIHKFERLLGKKVRWCKEVEYLKEEYILKKTSRYALEVLSGSLEGKAFGEEIKQTPQDAYRRI